MAKRCLKLVSPGQGHGHCGLRVRDPPRHRFAGRVSPPTFPKPADSDHAWEAWWRESRGIAQVSDDETMRARTASYGLTYRLDALIGQVLDCLRDSGLQDNTLIVYSADHGDHLGERGLRRKLHRSNARMLAKVLDGWEPDRIFVASASAGWTKISSMNGPAQCARAMNFDGSSRRR